MKVPLVVKIAMMMNTVMATDGPASQFHHDRPRKSFSVSAAGPVRDPHGPEEDVEDASRVGEPVRPADADRAEHLVDDARGAEEEERTAP